MLTATKELFESKPFVLALLTCVAAATAVFGYNFPVAPVMAVLTPIMIALGAHGWAEVAVAKERAARETHLAIMRERSSLDAKSPQGGFVKLGALLGIAAMTGALVLGACASWFHSTIQPVVNNVITCSKAEEQAVTQGKSIIQITEDVLGTIGTALAAAAANSSDPTSAVEAALAVVYAKWGQPIVACVMNGELPKPGSATGLTPEQAVIQAIIAKHHWQFAAAH